MNKRKLLVGLGIVAFSFAFISCKKECTCTNTATGKVILSPASTKSHCKNWELNSNVNCQWK